jgi:hypothetical protein
LEYDEDKVQTTNNIVGNENYGGKKIQWAVMPV